MRRLAPVFRHHLPDGFELGCGIDHEDRHVDDVVERASGRFQDGVQIVERPPDLRLKVRLRRAVLAAAYLPRHEQKTIGPDRR
ncbi:hypothetical protein G6F35_014175 [Rhizopus arrhizus]|nr:hypothetical protein G6F35_014175 [Rhizopus arrhizus]